SAMGGVLSRARARGHGVVARDRAALARRPAATTRAAAGLRALPPGAAGAQAGARRVRARSGGCPLRSQLRAPRSGSGGEAALGHRLGLRPSGVGPPPPSEATGSLRAPAGRSRDR